jgi:hypothetical protein
MITPLKTRCRDLVERLRDIKAIRAKGLGQRELKAEVGVWKVEILKVEMMKMVDEERI